MVCERGLTCIIDSWVPTASITQWAPYLPVSGRPLHPRAGRAGPTPPLLVSTLRAAKRLANSYGLLTALRREYRQADLAEQSASVIDPANGQQRDATYLPYRASMVLLASLIAYPALGPTLFLDLHDTAASHSNQAWEQYRGTLTPSQAQGVWQNPADSDMTPVRALQWQALLEGLDRVSREAAAAHLDLPEPLTAWDDWVVPVGRLFPHGRDRQRPRTPTPPEDQLRSPPKATSTPARAPRICGHGQKDLAMRSTLASRSP